MSRFHHTSSKVIKKNNNDKKFTNGVQPKSASDLETKDERVLERVFQEEEEASQAPKVQETESKGKVLRLVQG